MSTSNPAKLIQARLRLVLVAFLVLQLTLVTISAGRGLRQTLIDAGRIPPVPNPDWPTYRVITSLTSSNQGYGFFAPSVSSEPRLAIAGWSRDTRTWRALPLGLRYEGQQLLGSFLGAGLSADGKEGKEIQGNLARSVATAMFNRNPDIDIITISYQAELIGRLRTADQFDRRWVPLGIFPFYRNDGR